MCSHATISFFNGNRSKCVRVFEVHYNNYLVPFKLYDTFVWFLLSKQILCKKSIAIMKKFDCEILTYLYVSRYPEFIYAILRCFMNACVCVCVYVSEHDSV